MTQEELYMSRCLEIAAHARGAVSPNPMVGAVIVHGDRIIGEGFHSAFGKPHAEVEAVRSVKDPSLLAESTLYVSLEPCCHYGKTPPCTELILRHHIPKIVVGCLDPNPKVGGKGIALLREAGCEVHAGVLERECRELNRRFFTFHTQKRPYLLLKWAQTADGFMDVERGKGKMVANNWITNEALKLKVHQWRAEESAIWVGANTLLHDNPQLNVRYAAGRQPLRILHLSAWPADREQYRLFDHSQPTLVFNPFLDQEEENLSYVKLPALAAAMRGVIAPETLWRMLSCLWDRQVQSVMVEGGLRTLQSFLNAGLWDEIRVLQGGQKWGRGLPAPEVSISPCSQEQVMDNLVFYYRHSR